MMKLRELDLYLTEKCNLHCCFCSVEANQRYTTELSYGKIIEIITIAKEFGLEDLHLTGGEPTLREDLERIIEAAVRRDLNVRLITNGTLLDERRLRVLASLGLKSVMISVDGMREYNDKIRGYGSFGKALDIAQHAIAMGIVVRINSVAWDDNQDQILSLADFLNEKGVHVYSIFLGSPLGYAAKDRNKVISPYAWRKFSNALTEKIVASGFRTKVVIEKGYLYEDEKELELNGIEGRGVGCFMLTQNFDFFLIRGTGDVYPCVFFSNEAPPVGNIKDENLDIILQRLETSSFYQYVGTYPEKCAGCKKLLVCKGGCRGYAKIYYGNWREKDPRCELADSLGYIPVCPIMKKNLNDDRIGGSSEQALSPSCEKSDVQV